MLVSDKDIESRLNSPNNLINRLRKNDYSSKSSSRSTAMSLFGVGKRNENKQNEVRQNENQSSQQNVALQIKPSFNPFSKTNEVEKIEEESKEPSGKDDSPNLDNLLSNAQQQVKLSLAHDNALKTLNNALDRLNTELDTMSGSKLPSAITAATKVVEVIRRERSEAARNNKGGETHYHFYTPVQKPLEAFEVIDAGVQ